MEAKNVRFASLNRELDITIVKPTEKVVRGKDWVSWGEDNDYPAYILGLAREVPTLHAIITGAVDYTAGDSVDSNRIRFNRRNQTPMEIVREVANNIWHFGGAYLLVTKAKNGAIGEIEVLRTDRIRSNAEGDVFWYSEEWEKSRVSAIKYAKWMPGTEEVQSILPIRMWGGDVYPDPCYSAAVKACETERSIDEFHLGEISRGFFGSYLVNFNNGKTTDEEMDEIEKDFTDKFCGQKNAGRVMFSWNDSKESMTTLQKMEISDYGEKYKTLQEHCRQQIFTAFRANPNLFGIPTEGNGFSNEEYEESFRLFNRTQIKPVQRRIEEAFAKLDIPVKINPFTMEG